MEYEITSMNQIKLIFLFGVVRSLKKRMTIIFEGYYEIQCSKKFISSFKK